MTDPTPPSPPDRRAPGDPTAPIVETPSGARRKGKAELRAFFHRTAVLMRLEPKVPERPKGAVPPGRRAATQRGWPRVRMYLLVAAALAMLALALRSTLGSVPLPEAALGVWRTDSHLYANRRFELGEKTLAFQTDDSAQVVVSHEISRVRKSEVPEGALYRVDYLDQPTDETPLTFEFILTGGDAPTIIFANQKKVVWRRAR